MPAYPAPGVTGPVDTADATVRVSSASPAPTDHDRRTGRTPAVVPVDRPDPVPPPPLLRLTGERIEHYELLAPGGVVVEVTNNLDTGETQYRWTDRDQLS